MSPDNPAPATCFRGSFKLFEELVSASRDWDLDFRQLGGNDKPFGLEQFVSAGILYSRACFDSRFHQIGGPTSGYRTFALQAAGCSPLRWCGQAVNGQSLMIFPKSGDFESLSEPGFDIFSLSIAEDLLEHITAAHFQRPLSAFIGPGRAVCNRAPDSVRKLRQTLQAFSDKIGHWQTMGTERLTQAGVTELEQTLTMLVLDCLDHGRLSTGPGERSKRAKAFKHALGLIEQTPAGELSLSNLVAQTGVSRRTIEYAFMDTVGVSPGTYLKALRLRALHQTLLKDDEPTPRLAAIGPRFGFHHPGQMAADYSQLFGELPSATLRRADRLIV